MALDPAELLAVYDAELRIHVPERLPEGVIVDRDGPLLRFSGPDDRGFLTYRDLGGLDGADLDALIERQRDLFAARDGAVEWKHHGHDLPADLPERLVRAGFVPDEEETVVIGPAAAVAGEPALPAGLRLREVTERADLERIVVLQSAIWGRGDYGWLARQLEAELAVDPASLVVCIVEAGDEVVCAGWVRFVERTRFATLWGGGTRPDWRGRGVYRALVVHRARLAAARGRAYLEVDASPDSRPILERLGLVAVTTTTPYVWKPASGPA